MSGASVSFQPWCLSHRADPAARAMADRHYNRQKIGSPQFVPPGSCLVLLTECARALWVTSAPFAEYVKHAWAGAWVCSAFRSEGAGQASDLITAAVAATLAHYGEPPALGMVTFVDRSKVRPTIVRGAKVWGWTYLKAGFAVAGETKGGLLALQLLPGRMPSALAARPRSMRGAPQVSFDWHGRGHNAVAFRRSELRRAARSKIEAIEAEAVTKIERMSLEAQTAIVSHGLESEAAKAFLDHMPALDQLMPPVHVGEIQALLEKREAESKRLGWMN